MRLLLRWAPARVLEAAARRTLRAVPGIAAIESLRVQCARGGLPRLTATLRVEDIRDPSEVCRAAAMAVFEQLPPMELRILVSEPAARNVGQVISLGSL